MLVKPYTLKHKLRRDIVGYLIVLPALTVFAIFKFWPMIWGIILSLYKWDGFTEMNFIGIENYRYMITQDKIFPHVLKNTLFFAIGIIIGNVAISLLLALLVNRELKGSKIYRTIFFLPPIMSFVMVGLLFAWIYNPEFGLINTFLSSIGLGSFKQSWLGNPKTALPALMLVDVWKWSGWHMVVYLAGLQTIPQEIIDAAKVDGATGFTEFRFIIWPLLKPYTFLNIVLIAIGAFNTFDLVYVTTRGGPGYATHVMLTYVNLVAFNYHKVGYAAALTYSIFFIVFAISITNALLGTNKSKE